MTDIGKMMAKVAALRELAARAGTQAEADAAAAQAEAIIAKYQLDEAEIDAATGARSEAVGEDATPLWAGARMERWKGSLVGALAKDHGCVAYADRYAPHASAPVVLKLVGRASDVAIVRYLFAWLTAEISRLSQREHGKAAQNAFRVGAVYGVVRKMRAARTAATAQQSASTGAAMVLASRVEEADAWLKASTDSNVKWRCSAAPTTSDRDALTRGREAGARINVGTAALPVGGGLMLTQGRR